MEISDANLLSLANHLQQTLVPDVNIRKPAEVFLQSVEGSKNYSLLLLNLIAKNDVDLTVRVAAAIAFKNFVKRNWKIGDDEVDKIHAEDRLAVKQLIVNLMLKSPETIQRQLSDAISVIGREDFPGKWPNLLTEMVEKFATGDFHIINGILHTAHSLFRRYRYEFKSTELWQEIKFVLENFAKPLTELQMVLMNLRTQHENDKNALKVIYSSLVMVAKIFNSLNCQDLPEFFEDNMNVWFDSFHKLLLADVPLLKTDEEEAGLMEQLKSQICDNLAMYAQKYDEEFTSYIPQFVGVVWNLLNTIGSQTKYDLLVSNAIRFLAVVADKDKNKALFQDQNTLGNICEKVIIPNMEFRDSDEEVFEDNPEEYIRRDIEGSDLDTRRRSACDLVRSLSKHFEQQMTAVFGQYVQVMLTKYAENPAQNWKSKDSAIYLVTSLAAKAQTQKYGITQTNQLVNITEFYQSQILPDLVNPNVNELPVLKADAIKYVLIFRNQLPPDVVKQTFPHLIKLLTSTSPVVHTYSACAIEKILLVRQTSDNTAMVRSEDLATVANDLLSNLFGVLATSVSKENEYVMKAIMRSLSTLQAAVVPFVGIVLGHLTNNLMLVARNPSKPNFNHYLFESLSLLVRNVCKSSPQAVTEFEASLFPIFQQILEQDIAEFVPYVFQIFSLTLRLHTDGITEPYMQLFPFLLAPTLWERQGNIHPLTRLLRTYIMHGPAQIVETGKLGAILGVFQKLIASKTNDHEGFSLMQTLVEYINPEVMSNSICDVFRLLFQRLQSSKTVKYTKCLLTFFSFYAIKSGASNLIQRIDSIQPQMFGMLLDRIITPELQKISDQKDKKICAVGVVKILCEAPETFREPYIKYWGPLLQALIGLFELPEDTTEEVDEHFVEIDESVGYQAAYSKLAFAGTMDSDILKGAMIQDPKVYLAQSLGTLSAANPGKVGQNIMTIAVPAQEFLKKYFQVANVQLL